ncbi:MAG TPA: type II pantothenate kinase [Clostridiales bacterium]|nr:type II pantothenate kinase [Clostridiales bacterium]
MSVTIGIDIGGSTTKIVGFVDETMMTPFFVKADDPIASLYGAFGKFLSQENISIGDVDRVIMTGVGSSYLVKPIYGIPTGRVQEFIAIGLGGQYITKLDRVIVVSMGTGTALIKADKKNIYHMGGSGIGGGTLLGLADKILKIRDVNSLINLAYDGDLSKVDLLVHDLSRQDIPGLPPDTTAANFGRINDMANASDLALGILNLVFQTVGIIANFASKGGDIKDIVLTGNLTTIPQAKSIMSRLSDLYSINFIIPEHSEYATSVGAALAYKHDVPIEKIE